VSRTTAALSLDKQIADVSGNRGQILRELRRQIGTKGVARITMRDLAAASGVTTKTLYNLFGSKDALISETIRYTYKSIMTSIMGSDPDIDAFGQLVAFVCGAARFNLSERMYVAAAVYAYYSADSSSTAIHRDFREFVTPAVTGLLVSMQDAGELHRWSPPAVLSRQIVDSMMSTAAEWSKGVIRDSQLLDASLLSVLSLMHAHLTDRREPDVRARLKSISLKLTSKADSSSGRQNARRKGRS
jgi:AcrR family transcriptional regulator